MTDINVDLDSIIDSNFTDIFDKNQRVIMKACMTAAIRADREGVRSELEAINEELSDYDYGIRQRIQTLLDEMEGSE